MQGGRDVLCPFTINIAKLQILLETSKKVKATPINEKKLH